MTFHNNLAQAECPTCRRRVSKTNLAAHVAKCHNLTKNELCTAAWRRAADVLREEMRMRALGRFRTEEQERAINDHISRVIIPFLEKKARDVEARGKHEARHRDSPP
jgi:hypothetical protein